ncbi:MAG: hypothetical protein PHU81_02165 [Acidobacteriota bacterium]|nr:hypothetical protein [Acidobacteriota bacterium]
MENKFFGFVKPYLSFIDQGHFFRQPFSWLYGLLAILNLIFPLYILFSKTDIFKGPFKFVLVFLLIWVVIAFAGWIGFQIWWDRMMKIAASAATGAEFVATPIFSHFIQTLGEWFGTLFAIVGFGGALISMILVGDDGYSFLRLIGLRFPGRGWLGILLMPIIGYLIVIFTRFLAEQFRALAAIANNTKK